MMFEKVQCFVSSRRAYFQLKLSSKLRKLSSQICYILTGLSTKQRKRLTIAVELVANPSIIFMDEPTSGLDARAAAIVMRTVRNTVDTGRTVICTIHQSSIDIFEAFASSHEERGTSHLWWQAWCEFTNHDKLLSGNSWSASNFRWL